MLVDEKDHVLGPVSPQSCFQQGLRHRAVTVLIFNANRELYLQLRSHSVYWYPDTWTASATGHVRHGETYKQAAFRELQEELGIQCRLRGLGKLRTPPWPYGDLTELEFISVFDGRYYEAIRPSSVEVAGGGFIALDRLNHEIEEGTRRFTPDLLLALSLLRREGKGKRVSC